MACQAVPVGDQAAEDTVAEVAPETAAKDPILFHDGGWQSLWIENAIAMFITEHGYGYPTEQISVSTDVMKTSLPLGDEHVNMEVWPINSQEWYDENIAAGTLIDLGQIFESATQGWYVPRYVIEGDPDRGIEPMAPDLKSVFDLSAYYELFADPEDPSKGVWVNCIIGWNCQKIQRIKATAYGLDEFFNVIEPGAAAGIDAAIAGAYERGEPILSYYWEPTWILGKYDMVQLEEPPYSDECWAAIGEAAEQDPFGTVEEACAYQVINARKVIYSGFKDRAPEVVEFLEKMFLGTARINELSAWMEENEAEAADVAVHFLQTYEDLWREWVPEDVAEKVKAALP